MESNSCENGSLNMEINGDGEVLMKNKSSLYLKSAEIDCGISSKEKTEDNTTGKNRKTEVKSDANH
jgi:pleckstrin family protein A (phosphoinositide binding specific) protein 8